MAEIFRIAFADMCAFGIVIIGVFEECMVKDFARCDRPLLALKLD